MPEEKLTAEEIKNKLMLNHTDMGDTVLHTAAECGNVELLQKLWEWAKERLTTEEVNKKIICHKPLWMDHLVLGSGL